MGFSQVVSGGLISNTSSLDESLRLLWCVIFVFLVHDDITKEAKRTKMAYDMNRERVIASNRQNKQLEDERV